jgi:transposase
MIDAELRAEIRRLFYAEHWTVGTIAATLHVHRDTVGRAIGAARFVTNTRPVRATLMDPYKDFVGQTLKEYPRLRATRIYAMLKDRGYTGSAVTVRRYVKTIRPQTRREAFLRMQSMPGEQGQVDWGHFGKLEVGATKRTLSCFVLVLSHSRAMYARFFLDQSMESFLRGHVAAFEALGGAPRQLLYDNLKSAVLERYARVIRYQPRLLELAGHYHFSPQPCAPYRGNEKGKVERTIQYLRHSFFAGLRFSSLDELNAKLHAWIRDVAHARPVPGEPGGRTVAAALEEERGVLLPLPENPFSTDLVAVTRSGKTPYVRFDKNDYSIPHTLITEPITLVASESRVRILDAAQAVVADHARSYDAAQRIEEPAHLAGLRWRKRSAGHTPRDRVVEACPRAHEFFAELCRREVPLSSQTAKLRRLLDVHGPDALDAALAEALARGAVSAASVAHILDRQQREANKPPPLVPIISSDPRVRDLRVIPHSLDPYDALAGMEVNYDDIF